MVTNITEEEILLTLEEINQISADAQHSWLMHNPGILAKFTKNWWDVFHITPIKKLIFIKGHRYTGLEHINYRHRFFTNHVTKLSNCFLPVSRFSVDSGILEDYTRLVECLYDPRFLLPQKNKRPDIFDYYEAKVDFKGHESYCLIVYKDSKIVHTLFPLEKRIKKKYQRREAIIQLSTPTHVAIVFPYTDINDKICFGIGINFFITEKVEVWDAVFCDDGKIKKQVSIGEMKKEYKYGIENRIKGLEFADMSKIENWIIEEIKKGAKKDDAKI